MDIDDILKDLCRKYEVRQETIAALVRAEGEKQRLKKKRGLPDELYSIIEKDIKGEPLPEQI